MSGQHLEGVEVGLNSSYSSANSNKPQSHIKILQMPINWKNRGVSYLDTGLGVLSSLSVHVLKNLKDCRLTQFRTVLVVEDGQIPSLCSPLGKVLLEDCLMFGHKWKQQTFIDVSCTLQAT